jgi:hypothetical protein
VIEVTFGRAAPRLLQLKQHVQRTRCLNCSDPFFHQALTDTAIALEEKRTTEVAGFV